MRVAFFGSTEFSCLIFKALLESAHQVVAVTTQPDHPAGRKLTLCPTPVCLDAGDLGIPVFKPERVRNNPDYRAQLSACRPEAFLLASYGQIIPKKILALTEWPLNVHPSPLPLLRGPSPVRNTLLNGWTDTECCIMRMTPRVDDGDVMLRRPLAVPATWNYLELKTALGALGGRLAVEALDQVAAGVYTLTPQNHARATYSRMYDRSDTLIDWKRPAPELENFVRAWDPDIGALTTLPDGRRLKVWRARAELVMSDPAGDEIEPGTVLMTTKKAAWIETGELALRLLEVQPENKPRMPIDSFLAGNVLNAGECLGVHTN
ncbi:methionyl-tRNA formyltransferase [bacterium]|nr:methionyl-tRNA formyltransferase [bacterium]